VGTGIEVGEGEKWGCLGRLKLEFITCGFCLSHGQPVGG
jgi:hypothetical protein